MSLGNPKILVRLPTEELDALRESIESANAHRSGEPWTMSEFVRVAIREKLAKMERSRTNGGKRKRPTNQAQ